MIDVRQFPILAAEPHERQSVPWSLIEPHARQCLVNHSQTATRLADRGGLTVRELYAVVRGQTPWDVTAADAAEWLRGIP